MRQIHAEAEIQVQLPRLVPTGFARAAAGTRLPGMLLTFDDGPDPIWTPRVLRALDAAVATFFVLGPAARAHAGVVDALRARGHAVELHGSAHLRHSAVNADALRRDTHLALEDLQAVGVRPSKWRTPWGVVTQDTLALADELDLELVGWSVDTHDWRGDSADAMLGAIAPQLADSSVVLMHDGLGPGAQRENCAETVRLVESLVRAK